MAAKVPWHFLYSIFKKKWQHQAQDWLKYKNKKAHHSTATGMERHAFIQKRRAGAGRPSPASQRQTPASPTAATSLPPRTKYFCIPGQEQTRFLTSTLDLCFFTQFLWLTSRYPWIPCFLYLFIPPPFIKHPSHWWAIKNTKKILKISLDPKLPYGLVTIPSPSRANGPGHDCKSWGGANSTGAKFAILGWGPTATYAFKKAKVAILGRGGLCCTGR